MSDRTATMSAPAKESSTTTTTRTRTILAIDLGKFRSVACRYDPATGEPSTYGITCYLNNNSAVRNVNRPSAVVCPVPTPRRR